MAEITPIMPSSTVSGVRIIRRDDSRKNKEQKQPQSRKPKSDQAEAEQQPVVHIDEIV